MHSDFAASCIQAECIIIIIINPALESAILRGNSVFFFISQIIHTRPMVGAVPLEVAKTGLEVADLTWTAVEGCCRHHNLHHHGHPGYELDHPEKIKVEQELESWRSENCRLRIFLEEQRLKLLESCPPDLQPRVISNTLESNSGRCFHQLPVSEVSVEEDPERGEIDTEDYVIVDEGNVVDGMVDFMVQCVVSDPKAKDLPPQKLQKAITKAMEGESKLEKVVHIYGGGRKFRRWSRLGIALAGLYRARGVLMHAAKVSIKAL